MTLPAIVLPFQSPVAGMPEPTAVTFIRGNDNTLRGRLNDLRDYVSQDKAVIVTVTGNTTITATDEGGTWIVDASSGAVTITLPAVADSDGRRITVKKVDASVNAVTVEGNAAETIDGAANFPLTAQYQRVTVHCDGTEWWIL